ncbi:MAG: hypothetical protein AAFZ15_34560 [Bacteroidota bacterium]
MTDKNKPAEENIPVKEEKKEQGPVVRSSQGNRKEGKNKKEEKNQKEETKDEPNKKKKEEIDKKDEQEKEETDFNINAEQANIVDTDGGSAVFTDTYIKTLKNDFSIFSGELASHYQVFSTEAVSEFEEQQLLEATDPQFEVFDKQSIENILKKISNYNIVLLTSKIDVDVFTYSLKVCKNLIEGETPSKTIFLVPSLDKFIKINLMDVIRKKKFKNGILVFQDVWVFSC